MMDIAGAGAGADEDIFFVSYTDQSIRTNPFCDSFGEFALMNEP